MLKNNDGGHDIEVVSGGSISDEMNALDALGPLTRQAIYDSPIRYAAVSVMQQIKEFEAQQRLKYPENVRHLLHLDPAQPDLDRNIAEGLNQHSKTVIARDRSQLDAEIGVIPLRPNISVKTLREQRRVLRKVRW